MYHVNECDFTVRDFLALDRTKLANERTLLAYIRTFVGMVASGAALLKIFDFPWTNIAATILLIAGPLFLVYGIVGFFRTNRRMNTYVKK